MGKRIKKAINTVIAAHFVAAALGAGVGEIQNEFRGPLKQPFGKAAYTGAKTGLGLLYSAAFYVGGVGYGVAKNVGEAAYDDLTQ